MVSLQVKVTRASDGLDPATVRIADLESVSSGDLHTLSVPAPVSLLALFVDLSLRLERVVDSRVDEGLAVAVSTVLVDLSCHPFRPLRTFASVYGTSLGGGGAGRLMGCALKSSSEPTTDSNSSGGGGFFPKTSW